MVGAEGGSTTPAIYSSLLRMLATCAAASPQVAHSLLELGMASTLSEALKGCVLLPSPAGGGTPASPMASQRGPEQLTLLLQLLAELLPPLPSVASPANIAEATASRRELLAATPELVSQYAHAAAAVLLQVRVYTEMHLLASRTNRDSCGRALAARFADLCLVHPEDPIRHLAGVRRVHGGGRAGGVSGGALSAAALRHTRAAAPRAAAAAAGRVPRRRGGRA